MALDRTTDRLWCRLRSPVVQAYAVREQAGFNLIDASTADTILALLATLRSRVRIWGIPLFAAGHDGRPMVGVFNADAPAAVATARRPATVDADAACFGHGEPLAPRRGSSTGQAMIPRSC